MKKIDVDLDERSYPIYIGETLYSDKTLLQRHINSKQVLVVRMKSLRLCTWSNYLNR